MRYIILPMRPAGTEGWSEDQLIPLITRDSLIGVALARSPRLPNPQSAFYPR